MSIIPGIRPTGSPTRQGLRVGQIFTTAVFLPALTGAGVAIFAPATGGALAIGLFALATAIYLVGSVIMYVRGDYILRMFGCAWPIILAKVDEMQRRQRERAFAFTFIVFLSSFALTFGAHVGAMLAQSEDGELATGFLPTHPWGLAALLGLVFYALTLMPQAYLAWTLIPLEEDEA